MGKRQSARLRVLIRRCRIKAAFNTSSDKGLELRVTHALHVDCGGGFELSRQAMSALPPKADMCSAAPDVCFVPIADNRGLV